MRSQIAAVVLASTLLLACSEAQTMRMRQRSEQQVASPAVTISLGDIHAVDISEDDVQLKHEGGTPVKVIGADGAVLLDEPSAARGQPMRFEAEGRSWTLTITSIEAHTITDDFATLELKPGY